ncbi:LysR substrate-binding domain-containing protein [Aeromonas veronii]
MLTKSSNLQPLLALDEYPLPELLNPLPPILSLQAFIAVAELGSLSRAATHLHRTQGTVSRQIQLLETYYGRPLFERSTLGMQLNPAGIQISPNIRQAVVLLSDCFHTMTASKMKIRLQVPPTLALRWLLPRLPLLSEALPELSIELVTFSADMPALIQLGCDAAIIRGNQWPGLNSKQLFSESLVPVCPPILVPSIVKYSDLLDHTLLHPEHDSSEWQCWLQHHELELPSVKKGIHFDSQEMALNAAILGQGIAIVDPRMLERCLSLGELAIPFNNPVHTGLGYQFVFSPNNYLSSCLEKLSNMLGKI